MGTWSSFKRGVFWAVYHHQREATLRVQQFSGQVVVRNSHVVESAFSKSTGLRNPSEE
jgi:hypothetical protein